MFEGPITLSDFSDFTPGLRYFRSYFKDYRIFGSTGISGRISEISGRFSGNLHRIAEVVSPLAMFAESRASRVIRAVG